MTHAMTEKITREELERMLEAANVLETIKANRFMGRPLADIITLALQAEAMQREGWVMVPKEPNPAMVEAAIDADDKRTGAETCKHIYRAMISSFPEPK